MRFSAFCLLAITNAIDALAAPTDLSLAPIVTRDDDNVFVDCDIDRDHRPEAVNKWVGNHMAGDHVCLAGYTKGVFPNRLEIDIGPGALTYLKIGFTDGSDKSFGKPYMGQKAVLSWNPFTDTFKRFEIGTKWDNLVKTDRIVAWTAELDACNEDREDCSFSEIAQATKGQITHADTTHKANRGEGGKGLLLGFRVIFDGHMVQAIVPQFASAGVDRAEMKNPKFDPSFEDLNALAFDQRKMKVWRRVHWLNNLKSDTPAAESFTKSHQVQQGTKVTATTENGHETGFEFGVGLNVEFNFPIGVPSAGKGVKAGASFDYKYKETTFSKTVSSKEDFETVTKSEEYTVKKTVKPHSMVKCTALVIQSNVSLRYEADFKLELKNGVALEHKVKGRFTSADYSEAIVEYEDIDTDSEEQPESGDDVIDVSDEPHRALHSVKELDGNNSTSTDIMGRGI